MLLWQEIIIKSCIHSFSFSFLVFYFLACFVSISLYIYVISILYLSIYLSIYNFSFAIHWKARNKLLHYDLSVAFSIGTLMVGYLSFCWEGIDFLSLPLGIPYFHLFH